MFNVQSRTRKQLEVWLGTLSISGRVLDVGGSQKPLPGRVKDWNPDEYLILDLPVPHENHRKPDMTGDIQSRDQGRLDAYRNYFDAIFCLEVAEYWHDPVQALANLQALLKPGGKLYLSTHWLYGYHRPEGEDCLRFTRASIGKLSILTGFRIIDVRTRTVSVLGRLALMLFYRLEGMHGLDFSQPEVYAEGHLVVLEKV